MDLSKLQFKISAEQINEHFKLTNNDTEVRKTYFLEVNKVLAN